MKKSLIIIFLSITALSANVNAQEPSRKDALDFICKNIRKYFNSTHAGSASIELNYRYCIDGVLTYDIKGSNPQKATIDLNKVTKFEYGTIYGPKVSKESYLEIERVNYSDSFNLRMICSLNAEDGLEARIEKAFEVLIKANNPKDPNDKF